MFKVGKFIVLNRGHRIDDYIDYEYDAVFRGKGFVMVTYNIPGTVLFTIGETIPVISQEKGAIGLATPTKLVIDKLTTSVTFKFTEKDPRSELMKGLTTYYKMQMGTDDSGSSATGGGGFILPGLGSGNATTGNVTGKSSTRGGRRKDFDPFMDDPSYGRDDDDDDYMGY